MFDFNVFKNCYLEDNRALTEDKVLVHNLCIYKIPKKHTEVELYNYFAQFGPLEKLYFVYDGTIPNSRSHNVGFVNYTHPADAAKVLNLHYRAPKPKKYVRIKAGDSWCQPRQARLKNIHGIDLNIENIADYNDIKTCSNISNKTENHSNLLSLNDDCLEIICRQLDVRSQIYLSYVCQRFRRIFEMCCKSQYRIFEANKLEGLTLWQIRNFFQCAGPYIEKLVSLDGCVSHERIVDFISNFCPNIKFVSLVVAVDRYDNYFRNFCKNLQLINTLELPTCYLSDSHCVAFKKLHRLEHLVLKNNGRLTGMHLNKLKSLKTLNFYDCFGVKENNLISIIQSLTKLEALNMICSSHEQNLSTALHGNIAEHSKHLADLKIVCYTAQQYEFLTMLSKLRRLLIVAHAYPPNSFFLQLAERQGHQLESLEVFGDNYITYERSKPLAHLRQLKHLTCGNNVQLNNDCLRKFSELQELEELVVKRCPAITNEGLLQLLSKCQKLKRLNIQSCKKITAAFVFDAIKLFQERALRTKKEHQLTCWVGKTKLSKDILKDSRYIAGKALMKLSFDIVYWDHINENDDDNDEDEDNINHAVNENQNEDNENQQNDINNGVENEANEVNNDNENNEELNNDINNAENDANGDQNNFNENEPADDDEKPAINMDEVDCYDFYELFELTHTATAGSDDMN